ncbi:MAG TPA: putative baseplate assembly protein [Actinopolymorphaceae bacterium]|jgi:predicted phage baseplate assembly protein
MGLPAPNLDDRRFQGLVDDAKRLVQQRCPEWTDHNVSDPGVTLIETFAYMTDLLLYRLNQVPDRIFLSYLDLLGVTLFPPTAARVDVTLRLSAPQAQPVAVPPGTQVATMRQSSTGGEPVVFSTVDPLSIVPCSGAALAVQPAGQAAVDKTGSFSTRQPFEAFSSPPQPDDALLVGLSTAVPRCLVVLRFDCDIEGRGVDPLRPPLAWEAWTGRAWESCEVDLDETGGLNRAGSIELHVPAGHTASNQGERRAGWLRCRVVTAFADQPTYSAPPRIKDLRAHTIGGTTSAVNAEVVTGEELGTSSGAPGQRFPLMHGPVVQPDGPLVLEVAADDGWQQWQERDAFADCGPNDHVFTIDETTGEVMLGPAVREPDGSLRQYGAVPPKGAVLRLPTYRTGGGRRGNVARHAISVLKTSIPYITGVDNRRPAAGGVDGEDVESAKLRGPLLLRTRDRAVTSEDYEQLARQAAPEVGRVRCVPAGTDSTGVRLLVVPAAEDDAEGRLAFEQLVPADQTLAAIASYLDERRVIGARVTVEPPVYQGVTLAVRIRARPRASIDRLHDDAVLALYRYFHPLRGGPDGTGWPFGRPVNVGEVYAVLQRLEGVELVDEARLFPADPLTGRRGEQTQRLVLDEHALVFSYEHQVLVQGG